MSDERSSIVVIAPTVDDAIARGLEELGLERDEVDVEVLDRGASGLMGLGARDARVRLTVGAAEDQRTPADDASPSDATEAADDPVAHTARATLVELLDRLHVHARVSVRWGEPDEPDQPRPLDLEIDGQDLAALIGHRGETLEALQYIARLIVSKELGRGVPLTIDVDGYRARRKRQLTSLAERMAEQVAQHGRTMSLEPMNAADRRTVHLALRAHAQVTTQSIGEEPTRKVTIVPRQPTAAHGSNLA